MVSPTLSYDRKLIQMIDTLSQLLAVQIDLHYEDDELDAIAEDIAALRQAISVLREAGVESSRVACHVLTRWPDLAIQFCS